MRMHPWVIIYFFVWRAHGLMPCASAFLAALSLARRLIISTFLRKSVRKPIALPRAAHEQSL